MSSNGSTGSGGNVLVVSALAGGAAEAVLRAICQNDTDKRRDGTGISRLDFIWQEPTPGVSVAEGIFRVNGESDRKALLVIGRPTGLFLCDAKLSRSRHYSLAHGFGVDCVGLQDADYVVRISPVILSAKSKVPTIAKQQVDQNVRRAANEVCRFLFDHGHELNSLRETAEAAGAERLKRAWKHQEEFLESQKVSPVDTGRHAILCG